jgi:integrase/recombinase XerD
MLPASSLSSQRRVENVPTLAIADDTNQLVELWLHGKSPHSQDAYRRDVHSFLAFIECKALQLVTVNDVQAFSKALASQGYSPSTQCRKLSAVKSLLAYGHRIGILPVNAGGPVPQPKVKDGLAQRILSESQCLTMIALETNERNRALIRFLYATGARVSEVCDLKWQDLRQSPDGKGMATLFGKGGKTRTVAFSRETWDIVQSLRQGSRPDFPVFLSRKGGHLTPSHVQKIVASAGKRAGIEGNVSPHWLRHSHASHALNRGVPIHLVQATLGHSSIETTGRYLHANPADSSGLHLPV